MKKKEKMCENQTVYTKTVIFWYFIICINYYQNQYSHDKVVNLSRIDLFEKNEGLSNVHELSVTRHNSHFYIK